MGKWQPIPEKKAAKKPAQKDVIAAEREGVFTRRVATVVAGLLAVQLFYTVVFGKNGLRSYVEKQRESQVLAQQIQRLQQENEQLKEETTRLQQDPSAIEHQAREQLHFTRPGEVIYTLPDAPPAAPAKK